MSKLRFNPKRLINKFTVIFSVVFVVLMVTLGWCFGVLHILWQWFTEIALQRQLFPHGVSLWAFVLATPLFYLLLAVIALATSLALADKLPEKLKRQDPRLAPLDPYYAEENDSLYTGKRLEERQATRKEHADAVKERADKIAARGKAIMALFVAASLFSVYFVVAIWGNDRDGAASYAEATTVVVQDVNNPPATLNNLFAKTRPSNVQGCDLLGNHWFFACIQQAETEMSWENRKASATGALKVMRQNSESDNNSFVADGTLTYLYPADGSGKWSVIRDGKRAQPMTSVLEWDGSSNRPEECRFDGQFELDKSFNGLMGHNLNDEIAAEFRNLLFDSSDLWGYCNGDEPVIVIPVYVQEGYKFRTTTRSAGIIRITGSPSGDAVMEHIEHVKAGEYPGPVYPASLAKRQREASEWLAGRYNLWFRGFGYRTSEVASQKDNPSEYLLRSKLDGRVYWVTPTRPQSTDSEQIVAYSLIPADEANEGALNEHRLVVLNGTDPRVVDMQRLYTRVADAVNIKQSAFFTPVDPDDSSSAGKLAEFLPVDDTTWQVYAERGGNVVYRIIVNSDAAIAPQVTSVTDPTAPATPSGEASNVICGTDITKLTKEQVTGCAHLFVDELARR